jgi:hypothetical protein
VALEERATPERAEQDKRDDEDDRTAPEEEPVRDREVANASDPVREQRQGPTSSTPIS